MGKVRSYLNGMDPYPLEKASRSEMEGLEDENKINVILNFFFIKKIDSFWGEQVKIPRIKIKKASTREFGW